MALKKNYTSNPDTWLPQHREWATNMVEMRDAKAAGIAAGYSEKVALRSCSAWMGPKSPQPHLRDWVKKQWLEQEKKALARAQAIVDQEVIDVFWVLQESVQMLKRNRDRPLLDKRGQIVTMPDGSPVTDPNDRIVAKALEIVGKNQLVKAFDNTVELEAGKSLSDLLGRLSNTAVPPAERD